MKLTPEELAALSPDERAALQGEDAEQHLATIGDQKLPLQGVADTGTSTGIDPGEGDDEDGESDDTDATAASAEGKPAPTAEEAAAALEELAPPASAEPQKLPTYTVEDTDFKAQRAKLADDKKAMMKDWSDGKLTDDEFAQRTIELDEQLADLAVAQGRAAALREANEQHARQQAALAQESENAVLRALALRVKDQVDYTANNGDNAAARQYDALMTAARLDPENAGKTYAQLANEVHDAVLALRGIAKPAAAPTPAPSAKAPRDVPKTLAGIPDAAPIGVADEVMEVAGRLEGEDLERFLAGLPADKLRKVMRTADNSFFNAG